jgi:hypothetical protein
VRHSLVELLLITLFYDELPFAVGAAHKPAL